MKTVIITGATGAMGWEATKKMLIKGYTVVATYRTENKIPQEYYSLPDIVKNNLIWNKLDLSCSESISQFVSFIEKKIKTFHILLNNAGTLQRHYKQNADGIELTYATNFLGTKLLTEKLIPFISPTAGHIIFTSSISCYLCKKNDNIEQLSKKEYGQLKAYAQSKMALTLYAQKLFLQYPNLHINCTDPGLVNTPILKMDRWFDKLTDKLLRSFLKKAEEGIVPAIRAMESEQTNALFRGKKKSFYNGYGYPKHLRLTI